ncbi:MAG: methylmalonyl-CoA carboxyltransferase [Dehalococcoidia bacterium]|nr:methylmalonyl-CoA carboxyltransferase [Dehalococcoidia bacterium]
MNDNSKKLEELQEKRATIRKHGGDKRVETQHEKGKLTARERIALLMDEGTFVEFDDFMKTRSVYYGLDKMDLPADGVVTGVGKVNGRKVAVYAQDFTVLGGSLGETHALKISRMQDLALQSGIPCIAMLDSGGARIQEGIDSLDGYGRIFFRNSRSSGIIPQISIILGPTAGGAVYSPAITDFIIMTKKSSTMYITGPAVVKDVLSEEVTHEQLGGGLVHNQRSGVAHFLSSDDDGAIATAKELLSYIPQNFREEAPRTTTRDSAEREDVSLRDVIPSDSNKPYDVKDVITKFVDDGQFFEVHRLFAPNIVVGFARIDGRSIGIIANQAKFMAGVLDINASDKASRFIRFCDCFNIPLLTLVDVPGYMPGTAQEHGGIIRHGAKLLYVYSEASVPKVTLILRKAYGGAYVGMCSKYLGADMVLAYPSAEIAVMGASGAAEIVFAREIKNAEDPAAVRKQRIEEYKEQFSNPYRAAERGSVDDIIDPKDTRMKLARAFDILETKQERCPEKKHGNMPL